MQNLRAMKTYFDSFTDTASGNTATIYQRVSSLQIMVKSAINKEKKNPEAMIAEKVSVMMRLL